MTAADDLVWLKHKDTGHLTELPAAAVAGWRELGWAPTDERPVEVNPVTAEMPREWFEPIPAPEQAAEKPTTKTKPAAGASTKGSD